jgi:hypothetical protein
MSNLDDWTDAVCAELGLDPDDATQKTVLNLTRVVAHLVDRPAAPLTSYLLGLAVGSGQPLAETAAQLQQLARKWQADHPPED